jgi:hypothetical protein
MKRISLFSIVCVAVLLVVAACSKNDGKHCTFVSPAFVFVKFTQDELDTIIVRRFPKGNSFEKPIDTTIFAKGDVTYKEIGRDSITFKSNREEYVLFTEKLYENDWEVYVPSINRTGRITNVTGSFSKSSDAGETCRSFVKSLEFEGSQRTYTTWFGDSYRLHMQRN